MLISINGTQTVDLNEQNHRNYRQMAMKMQLKLLFDRQMLFVLETAYILRRCLLFN
jgi:hypothetical protein